MRKIAVLTDSACDIPVELQEKYGIDILPFTITLDGVSYVERKDFTFDEYYQMLREAKGTPSTAHITAMQFCDQFCKYLDEGYTDVLYVSINSTGSATHDAAVMGVDLLNEERPGHESPCEHEGQQDDHHEDGEGPLLANLLDVDLQPYAEHQQDQSEVLQEGDDLLFGEDRPLVLE